MKIVINRCYGSFELSEEAYERLIALGVPRCPVDGNDHGRAISDLDHPESRRDQSTQGMRVLAGRYGAYWLKSDAERGHPLMVRVVEELGSERASGQFAKLKIVEVPDGVDFEIDEYDGIETVRERGRSWA